ncbi:hypothetical protein A2890_01285 [candidate division WWE3 bacterium RIFCSPLOWO2_01_FULL_53_14]|uniref:CMP/dCMP-type deaminase domain-containing protein n=1 Tax=candidate division WWE3 bacterium RIFCSPLOWO2_01_FULL_53_14 TaxID=1802628 RepID=A0A1F4W1T9_UNCKA|nr:MAG: hypothetical protein A2890_01285 [candidate division WWE3 bacterium RIFCSPLOWO2_01_FULL_53_14]
MRTIERTIRVEILNRTELSLDELELIRRAAAARRNAQAPYSHYQVGAAVLSESGTIYIGCNVENANFTSTTHAEQNAISSMIAYEGPAKVLEMAIVGAPKGQEIKQPPASASSWRDYEVNDFCFACGHCLGITWENSMVDPNVKLLRMDMEGVIARTTIGDAFPMPFGPESLGVDIREG